AVACGSGPASLRGARPVRRCRCCRPTIGDGRRRRKGGAPAAPGWPRAYSAVRHMKADLSSPAVKSDPFPFYARPRPQAPVHPVTLPDGRSAWLVTRYDDVAAVLKDDRFAKDPLNALSPEQQARQPWMPAYFRPLTRNMLDRDAPDHTRLRGLVHKAF